MVRRAGACLGLFAFCVTLLRGMAVGNPPTTILSKALWALVLFFMLGLVLGYLAALLFDEHEVGRKTKLAEILEREAAQAPPASASKSDAVDDEIELQPPSEAPA